jgi:hypothetical protein
MSQPPEAIALAWRFACSLGGLRRREVGRAAITCSIFTLDPPKGKLSLTEQEQLRIRRIQGSSAHASTKCIPFLLVLWRVTHHLYFFSWEAERNGAIAALYLDPPDEGADEGALPFALLAKGGPSPLCCSSPVGSTLPPRLPRCRGVASARPGRRPHLAVDFGGCPDISA